MSVFSPARQELFSYTGDCQVVSPQLIMFLKVVTCTLADTMPFKCKSYIQTQHRILPPVARVSRIVFQPKVDKIVQIGGQFDYLDATHFDYLNETTPKLARAKVEVCRLTWN